TGGAAPEGEHHPEGESRQAKGDGWRPAELQSGEGGGSAEAEEGRCGRSEAAEAADEPCAQAPGDAPRLRCWFALRWHGAIMPPRGQERQSACARIHCSCP